jgi:hypothetical protein
MAVGSLRWPRSPSEQQGPADGVCGKPCDVNLMQTTHECRVDAAMQQLG